MTTENLALFRAMGAKMDFLNQRQRVISQNVSNADTPGYIPQDLKPVNFSRVLKNVTNEKAVFINTTQDRHMPPPNQIDNPREDEQGETYEVAPSGNSVIMEEQLINAGQTNMDYNLMTNIYRKNVSMMNTSIGSGR